MVHEFFSVLELFDSYQSVSQWNIVYQIYMPEILDDFNSGQKKFPNNFKRSKYLQYSIRLLSSSKTLTTFL